MIYIQVISEKGTTYIINVSQISHLTTANPDKDGVIIHLSCKTEIFTPQKLKSVLETIKRACKEELED